MSKRFFFVACIVLINYLAIEAIAYGFFRMQYGDFSITELSAERDAAIAQQPQDAAFKQAGMVGEDLQVRHVAHPYVGYVVDGRRRIDGCDSDEYRCFERVKTPIDGPMPKRAPSTYIVAIMGGSVAVGTVNGSSENAYERFLEQYVAEIGDRQIEIVPLAAGGYKQPQQLMLLNYMLSRGAEFDLVINIDGFNEVAIPSSEYKFSNLNPTFPRAWEHYIASKNTPEFLDLYADIRTAQKKLTSLAKNTGRGVFKYSPAINLWWKLRSVYLKNRIAQSQVALDQLQSEVVPREFRYAELGPDIEFSDWDNFNRQSIDLWMRASHQMHILAAAHGIKYFHFLQPNQYVEGSKRLTDKERSVAWLANQGYGWRYRLAYPMLKDMSAWLVDRGVNFYDLSDIYEAEEGDIYIDNCCHVNIRGSDLIIRAVAQEIGDQISAN